MNKFVCVFGAAALLAACAATESVSQADARRHSACRDVDPPIGSHMVKRADCAAPTAGNADTARRDAEILQQGQSIRTTGARKQ